MIIFFWIISVLLIGIIIGEIRFRKLRALKNNNENIIIKKWTDSIDKDMDVLEIECTTTEFVPTTKLAMRGSWRLAQDSVMSMGDFQALLEDEYSKSLH